MPLPIQMWVYACSKCEWKDFHQAELCPRCHSKIVKSSSTGVGKVATFTVIRYPPKGFEGEAPYIVALIDIENGPRVIGRIAASPDEIEVGSKVGLSADRKGILEFHALSNQSSSAA